MSPSPKEINADSKSFQILWDDGTLRKYSILDLRKKCPCASCRGGHSGKIGDNTKQIADILLVAYKKVGRYAINFIWSDTHDSGIYTYETLYFWKDEAI